MLVLAFLNLFIKDSVHLLIMVSDNFIICSVLFCFSHKSMLSELTKFSIK